MNATPLNSAKILRKAAQRSLLHGDGLSLLFRHGLMRDWWYFRDYIRPEVKWGIEDYTMALCLLSSMAETGDLPKSQGTAE